MIYQNILSFLVRQDYNKYLAYAVGYIIVAAMTPAWVVYKLKNLR